MAAGTFRPAATKEAALLFGVAAFACDDKTCLVMSWFCFRSAQRAIEI